MISLIVAASSNHCIGKDNKLLWHLPNDMKFFKATTWAMPIIMGRKTFESIGNKPLPGRKNIVLTTDVDYNNESITIAHTLEDALLQAASTNCKEIFIVGGGAIYNQTIAIANQIYMTRVNTNIDGDTFFPVINEADWQLEKKQMFDKDEKHIYSYSFEKWVKK
jgi:dihydrofolate reductase